MSVDKGIRQNGKEYEMKSASNQLIFRACIRGFFRVEIPYDDSFVFFQIFWHFSYLSIFCAILLVSVKI